MERATINFSDVLKQKVNALKQAGMDYDISYAEDDANDAAQARYDENDEEQAELVIDADSVTGYPAAVQSWTQCYEDRINTAHFALEIVDWTRKNNKRRYDDNNEHESYMWNLIREHFEWRAGNDFDRLLDRWQDEIKDAMYQ